MFVIKAVQHFLPPLPDLITWVGKHGFTDSTFAQRFETEEEAKTRIAELRRACYFLEQNEAGRPDYIVVRID